MRRPSHAAFLVAVATLVVSPMALAQSGDSDQGKVVYDRWCAGCHGETGAGDGVAAAFMLPRPRDFTRALFQIRTTASGELPTDDDMMRVIADGMPGTAMPEWRSRLTESQRRDVIAYIKTFSRFFNGASPEAVHFGSAPGGGADAVEEGRQVFQQLECFKCHGDEGRGDGASARTLTDDWDFPIRAADLTEPWFFNGGATVEDIYRRLRTGLDGTPMPSFSDIIDAGVITDEQLWRVAQYVRSLAPEAVPPPVRDVIRAVRVEGAVASEPDDSAWTAIERFYIPMVGQIIKKPRWFAPRVDGIWVQAMHNGSDLALRLAWDDPSASPDPDWQEWLEGMAQTMTDVDGPVPVTQTADRIRVQFPLRLSDDAERPYFLGGDTRHPVYLWRWRSDADTVEEGTGAGWGTFTPRAGSGEVRHRAMFHAGQWRLVLTRSLAPSDTATASAFPTGRAVPIAFYASDGSNGEDDRRGAVSSWYQIYLDVPTPTSAYVTPLVAVLLTAGVGMMVVWRTQRREGRRRN